MRGAAIALGVVAPHSTDTRVDRTIARLENMAAVVIDLVRTRRETA